MVSIFYKQHLCHFRLLVRLCLLRNTPVLPDEHQRPKSDMEVVSSPHQSQSQVCKPSSPMQRSNQPHPSEGVINDTGHQPEMLKQKQLTKGIITSQITRSDSANAIRTCVRSGSGLHIAISRTLAPPKKKTTVSPPEPEGGIYRSQFSNNRYSAIRSRHRTRHLRQKCGRQFFLQFICQHRRAYISLDRYPSVSHDACFCVMRNRLYTYRR
jgi:hypothetical protein